MKTERKFLLLRSSARPRPMASLRPGISKQNFNEVWTPAPLLTTNMEGGTAPHMTASNVIQKLWSFVPEEGDEGTN